jgi:hypothetical protein
MKDLTQFNLHSHGAIVCLNYFGNLDIGG